MHVHIERGRNLDIFWNKLQQFDHLLVERDIHASEAGVEKDML